MNGAAEQGTATTDLKKWPLSSKTTAGHKKVAYPAVVDKSKIYLPPLHMKRGFMNIRVWQMDKAREGFAYLKQKFSKINEAKIKDEFSLVHKLYNYSKTKTLVQN